MWPASKAPRRTIDSGAATGNASRRDADIVANDESVRRSRRLQELKRLVRKDRATPDLSPGMLDSPPQQDEISKLEQQEADNRAEDDLLAFEANIPEKIWDLRRAANSESFDKEWTDRMTDKIYEKVDAVLKNDVDIGHVSCFESVCLADIVFTNEDDVEAFAKAGHDLHQQYEIEYQYMPPLKLSYDNTRNKENRYQVLIKKRGVPLSNKPPLP